MQKYYMVDGIYEMRMEHVDDIVQLLIEGFSTNNQIWKASGLKRQQHRFFLQNQVKTHLQSQQRVRKELNNPDIVINHFIVCEKKLVGVLMHLEIEEYRRMHQTRPPTDVKLFSSLEKAGKQMLKLVDLKALQKGKYLYSTWGTHTKDSTKTALDKIYDGVLIYQGIRQHGFKGVVARSTNGKIVHMSKTLGTQVLGDIQFSHSDKSYQVWFLHLSFDNPAYRKLLRQVKKSLQGTEKAKL